MATIRQQVRSALKLELGPPKSRKPFNRGRPYSDAEIYQLALSEAVRRWEYCLDHMPQLTEFGRILNVIMAYEERRLEFQAMNKAMKEGEGREQTS